MSTVVLLHGLGRTERSMRRLGERLRAQGFTPWLCSYPSTRQSLAESAAYVLRRMQRELPGEPKLAVTHSAGGILARYLARVVRWDAVVMVAPPNHGSRLARAVARVSPTALRTLCGPVGPELAAPPTWPAPDFRFAVIAGTRPGLAESAQVTVGRRLGAFTEACQHDGTIHVDDARHPAMADYATVDAGHTFVCDHRAVAQMSAAFLRGGRLAERPATP